jgi:geranylgeranyl reductase family protein
METDADVIIAGAGPAGTLAAYELATHGHSVLILEKAAFPRYKVCGAGLTHKIIREIPFDISPILETEINQVIFTKGFKDQFARTSSGALLYCTNRDILDDYLLAKAVEAGARVIHGEKVTEVSQEKGFVKVITRSGTYRSSLLIGADGASSSVARSAGLREHIMPGLAWEAEIKVDEASLARYSGTVFLDWGSFPGGYGWVFPKKDHLSIGVGGPATLSKWMMPYYDKLVNYLEKDCGIRVTETSSLKSWPIPVRVKRSRFHNGRVLVAGDAGGLTDPLTGEGIYYAVRSGKIAAECCHNYLVSKSPSLAPYSDMVNRELMPELLEANRIKFLFNTVPLRIHLFVRDSERAWRAFGKILRGERWYKDVPAGFGYWKLLWGAACLVSKCISDFRERKFKREGFDG